MKVLGLSSGRKMQNTEVLIKSALMGAEEAGAEVEFIRMQDLDIKPCIFCKVCLFQQKGPEACVIKDDGPYLYNHIMDNDGFILGAPVYSLTPPGIIKMFEDRMMGPKTDKSFIIEAKKVGGKDRMGGPRYIDERLFKHRVGAFISLGGATTPNWLSFGLALLHTMTFPPQINVVDQMQVRTVGRKGHAVMLDEEMARARKMGRNVVKALKQPEGKEKWMGDEPGICPVCHSDLLTVGKKNPIECPVCGIFGTIKVDSDNNITVTFSKKEQARSRLTIAGKLEHFVELSGYARFMKNVDMKEIERRLEKFKGYAEVNKPVRKKTK